MLPIGRMSDSVDLPCSSLTAKHNIAYFERITHTLHLVYFHPCPRYYESCSPTGSLLYLQLFVLPALRYLPFQWPDATLR